MSLTTLSLHFVAVRHVFFTFFSDFLFFVNSTTFTVTTTFRGASLRRQINVTVKGGGEARMGIEDTPGRIVAAIDIIEDDQPSIPPTVHPKEVNL